MTVTQSKWIKTNLFNISTLLSVLLFIVSQAKWQEGVDVHIADDSVHMKFQEKIKTFVLKQHYDENQAEIKEDVKEMKADIKTILTKMPKQ